MGARSRCTICGAEFEPTGRMAISVCPACEPSVSLQTYKARQQADTSEDAGLRELEITPLTREQESLPPTTADDAISVQSENPWSACITPDAPPGATIRGRNEEIPPFSGIVVKHRMVSGGAETAGQADYELLEKIGEGGMGVVYAARQTAVDRTIAIKMIKAGFSSDAHACAKFMSEAAVTGELDHPNIVPIIDLGASADGTLFYAMKKVSGTPWGKTIRDKSLSENLGVLIRVADAVAFAHDHGVIHRDLKPDNVMLGDYGEVLLLDWGMAASVDAAGKAQKLGENSAFGGTPAYMAPEMALGDARKVGKGSDVYLLGGILYEIISGVRPHGGDSAAECMKNAAQNMIQPGKARGELKDIAIKAMAAEPADRYPSVKEFQRALRNYESHVESIRLADRAAEDLETARLSGNYKDFMRSTFGFDEARRIWPDNRKATAGVRVSRMAYATCALEKGDLDLAASLLADANLNDSPLAKKVALARNERDVRQKRLKVLTGLSVAAGLVIVAGAVVSALWIQSEQQATEIALVQAQTERDRVREEQKNTEAARAAEARQRSIAERNLEAVERENYYNVIALADKCWNDANIGRMKQLLQSCNPRYRNWEWGRLQYLARMDSLTLKGHSRMVNSAAFSADGRRIVTASHDCTAKVWDAETGGEILTLRGHKNPVNYASFSADGTRIVTASADRTAKIWEAGNGNEIVALEGHANPVFSAVFSADGRRVVTASIDRTAKIWDAGNGNELLTLKGHLVAIRSAAFSSDGRRIVTASDDRNAKVWDAGSGNEILTLTGHLAAVRSAAFSSDGRRIVTASDDRTVKVWDAQTGGEIRTLKGHTSYVYSAVFSADGRLISTGSFDNTAKIWDAQTGDEILTLKGHLDTVCNVMFSGDQKRLVTGSSDGTAKVWNVAAENENLTLQGHEGWVRCAVFSADGKRIVTGSNDHTAKVWDAETGKEILTLKGHADRVRCLAISADGKKIVTVCGDKTAKVWDAGNGSEILTLQGHLAEVRSAAFSADSRRIVTASDDRTVKVWDAETGNTDLTLEGHFDGVNSAVFSADDRRIVTASIDGTAKVWDAETGNKILTLKGHADRVWSAAFSADGGRIVTASWDNTAKVWDAKTGDEILTLKGHAKWIYSAAFSPDGRRIVTASDDKTAKIWDATTGNEVLTLKKHSGLVSFASFSSDGRRIVTSSQDGTAKVWDALDWTKSAEELDAGKLERLKAHRKAERPETRTAGPEQPPGLPVPYISPKPSPQ